MHSIYLFIYYLIVDIWQDQVEEEDQGIEYEQYEDEVEDNDDLMIWILFQDEEDENDGL